MTHDPPSPWTDSLLSRLGQLGVPAGGAPTTTAAALLAKAAVTAPVVIGVAGVKLYGILAAAALVGFGGGVVATQLVHGLAPPAADSERVTETTKIHEEPTTLLDETLREEAEPPRGASIVPWSLPTQPATLTLSPSQEDRAERTCAPCQPVIYETGACTHENSSLALDAPLDIGGDDDIDWSSVEPEPQASLDEAELEPTVLEPFQASTTTAEVEGVGGTRRRLPRPAEGHLRVGLDGGGMEFPEVSLGNLSGSVGLELLGPGPQRAAPLLAVNLDLGLASAEAVGTLAADGEVGLALLPQPDVRFCVAGVAGVRLFDEAIWGPYLGDITLQDLRDRGMEPPTGSLVLPTLGGRFGIVVGDRRLSPLSFRASFHGQAMFMQDTFDGTRRVVPRIGGTVGIDLLLPSAVK